MATGGVHSRMVQKALDLSLGKSLTQASSVTVKLTDGATMKNTVDSYIQCSYHGPLGVYSVCVCVGGVG